MQSVSISKVEKKEEYVIEVNNVEKKFKVYFDKGQSLKEKLLFRNRNHYEARWVLKGISFKMKKGEAIGLIGENGCGKSTLLKLMAKIMYPDQGDISLKGRVSSLIELGAGFHPDMSGRENIYINASIFGLSKKEIDKRLEEIIEFSELQEFIDNPVRTYSSGMYMRLAFSVAINVDADILLIDEILAVGDASFQAKCFNKMREIKEKGTTIVIVSHSLNQVEQICDRAIWINDGKIRAEGVPRVIIQEYMNWIMSKDNTGGLGKTEQIEEQTEKMQTEEPQKKEITEKSDRVLSSEEIYEMRKNGEKRCFGTGQVIINQCKLRSSIDKKNSKRFSVGEPIEMELEYKKVDPQLREAMVSIAIYRNDGVLCYSTNNLVDTGEVIQINQVGRVILQFDSLELLQGDYSLDVSIMKDYGPIYYSILNVCKFSVYNVLTDNGICRLKHKWIFE